MAKADPTGFFTLEDRLPLDFCPAWRIIRTKYVRYCNHCEAQIQEEFRRQKEEERKKKEKDGDGGSSAGSVDSWQLVVQAPPEVDRPVAFNPGDSQGRWFVGVEECCNEVRRHGRLDAQFGDETDLGRTSMSLHNLHDKA